MTRPEWFSEYRSFVLRTDFSDQTAWETVVAEIAAPVQDEGSTGDPFFADCTYIDDPAFDGVTAREILDKDWSQEGQSVMFLVDSATIASPEHAVLVLAVRFDDRGHRFRTVPTGIQSIQNNLSLANMDWRDFAETAASQPDGVFRGF